MLLAFSAVGIAFAGTAWHAARRYGARGLVVAWLVGAIAVTALMALRVQQQEDALGLSAEQQRQFAEFRTFFPMWAVALGAVVLALRAEHTRAPLL